MPLSLAKLNAKTSPATIDFGDGDVLNVTYYPMRLSGKMVADINSFDRATLETMTPDEQLALITVPAKYLETLLASWDLAEDVAEDGTPINLIPLDAAHIEALGLPVLWAFLMGLMNSSASGKSSAPAQADGAVSGSPNATPLPDTSSATAA